MFPPTTKTVMNDTNASKKTIELSVVIPALNEEENVQPLVEEIKAGIVDRDVETELIIVDDGSTDQTLSRLKDLQKQYPWLVILTRPEAQGQSSAMHAGIQAAKGKYIATLDADLQNNPAELFDMLEIIRQGECDMVQGDRSGDRQDNIIRRYGSIVGRKARLWIVGDPTRDTGCSARVVKAEIAKQFQLQFKGMHRFMPAYARIVGATIKEMPVKHRPRVAGETKYGFGVLNRGIAGFFDCLAVRWMRKRIKDTSVEIFRGDHS